MTVKVRAAMPDPSLSYASDFPSSSFCHVNRQVAFKIHLVDRFGNPAFAAAADPQSQTGSSTGAAVVHVAAVLLTEDDVTGGVKPSAVTAVVLPDASGSVALTAAGAAGTTGDGRRGHGRALMSHMHASAAAAAAGGAGPGAGAGASESASASALTASASAAAAAVHASAAGVPLQQQLLQQQAMQEEQSSVWSVELQPPQHGILRVAVMVGPPGSPFPLTFSPTSSSNSTTEMEGSTGSPSRSVLQCRVVAGEPSRATSSVFGKGLGLGLTAAQLLQPHFPVPAVQAMAMAETVTHAEAAAAAAAGAAAQTAAAAGLGGAGAVVAGEKADVNVCLRDGQGFPIYTAGQLGDDLALKFAFATEATAFKPSSLPSAKLQHVAGCYFQAIYTPPAHPSSQPYTLSISVLLSSRPIAFRSFSVLVVPQPSPAKPLQPSSLTALSALTGRQLANGFTARVPLEPSASAKDGGSGSFEFVIRLFDGAGTVVSQSDDSLVSFLVSPSTSLSPTSAAATAAANGSSSSGASGLSTSLTSLGDLRVSFQPAAEQRYTLLFWLPSQQQGGKENKAAQAVGWVYVQGVPGGCSCRECQVGG